MSLNHLAHRLLDVGRKDDAIMAAESAYRIYHPLYRESPDVFASEYASVLDTLVTCSMELRRYVNAVKYISQVVEILRGLTEFRPKVFRGRTARALETASIIHNKLRHPDEARYLSVEAATHYRILFNHNPEAFRRDLGSCLRRTGICFMDTERYGKASDELSVALSIFEDGVKTNPGVFKPCCADVLDDLHVCLTQLGHHQLASEYAGQAVELRRDLMDDLGRTKDLRSRLAGSYTNVFQSFRKLGSIRKASDAVKESIALYRELFNDHPEEFETDLTMALHNYSTCLSQLGNRKQALRAAEEAVNIHQNYSDRHSDQFRRRLAIYLLNFSGCLSDVGRKEESLELARKARRISPG
jgi:tetratricopeptide (TPR) repeat protein